MSSKLTTRLIPSVAAGTPLASGGLTSLVFHNVVLTMIAMICATLAGVCIAALKGSPDFLNKLLKHRLDYREVRDGGKRQKADVRARTRAYRDVAAARTNLYNKLASVIALRSDKDEGTADAREKAFDMLKEVDQQVDYTTFLAMGGPYAKIDPAGREDHDMSRTAGSVARTAPSVGPVRKNDGGDQVGVTPSTPNSPINGSCPDSVSDVTVEGETPIPAIEQRVIKVPGTDQVGGDGCGADADATSAEALIEDGSGDGHLTS